MRNQRGRRSRAAERVPGTRRHRTRMRDESLGSPALRANLARRIREPNRSKAGPSASYFLPKRPPVQQERGSMPRSSFLLLTLAACVGCAGTQSARAFIPRPAAEVVPVVTLPNRSAEHSHSLAESLARSLQEQEDEPMLARQGSIADKPSATPAVDPGSEGRASKMGGSER